MAAATLKGMGARGGGKLPLAPLGVEDGARKLVARRPRTEVHAGSTEPLLRGGDALGRFRFGCESLCETKLRLFFDLLTQIANRLEPEGESLHGDATLIGQSASRLSGAAANDCYGLIAMRNSATLPACTKRKPPTAATCAVSPSGRTGGFPGATTRMTASPFSTKVETSTAEAEKPEPGAHNSSPRTACFKIGRAHV